MDTVTRTCGRCRGEGVIAAFAHVAGGRCVACKGKGKVTRYTAAGKAAAEDREARHAALSQAAADADRALRPRDRHHVRDFREMEANDPAAYAAALAAVRL
jgi:RecJ-like exonuclease